MLETVKNAIHTVSSPTSELARAVAGRTAHLAHRVSDITVDTAKRVGPKRALIGLAAVGVLVGGAIMIMRYLRDREDAGTDADAELEEDLDAGSADGGEHRRKLSRAQRKHQRAAHMH